MYYFVKQKSSSLYIKQQVLFGFIDAHIYNNGKYDVQSKVTYRIFKIESYKMFPIVFFNKNVSLVMSESETKQQTLEDLRVYRMYCTIVFDQEMRKLIFVISYIR